MTIAYVIIKKDKAPKNLSYVPWKIDIPKHGIKANLDYYKDSDFTKVFEIAQHVVNEGPYFPQDEMDADHFKKFYLCYDSFVVRDEKSDDILAYLTIKPNFPGRSSHVCTAWIIVNPNYRKRGLGEIITKYHLRLARDLDYKAMYYNMVYATNIGHRRILHMAGFRQIGRIPDAGYLGNDKFIDAIQYYFDLETLDANGLPPNGWPLKTPITPGGGSSSAPSNPQSGSKAASSSGNTSKQCSSTADIPQIMKSSGGLFQIKNPSFQTRPKVFLPKTNLSSHLVSKTNINQINISRRLLGSFCRRIAL